MLAGFKSYLANSKLTEVKKASDMVPQIGQGLVVLRGEDFFHAVSQLKLYPLNIVSRYIRFFVTHVALLFPCGDLLSL